MTRRLPDPAAPSRSWHAALAVGAVVLGAIVALIPIGPPAAAQATPAAAQDLLAAPLRPPLVVVRSFAPPANPWDAGERGVDLAAVAGEPVFAGAAGVVAYAGLLAGRGVVSIDDGSSHLTYEPVDPTVDVGSSVIAGSVIGTVADQIDTCGPPGSCLHWGVRTDTGYLDPIALLGVPKVRLLPIWSGGITDASQPIARAWWATPPRWQPGGVRRACQLPHLAPQCW